MIEDPGGFGMELVLDLYGCDPAPLRTSTELTRYVLELCHLIEMTPYGEPFLARFGLNAPKAAGYSVVQLIETSSITGHFSELWNAAYINIFSCKAFDAAAATEFTRQFFRAGSVNQRILVRK